MHGYFLGMKRFVYINDESYQNDYCDNRISNTKYNLLNFLPKNLWEQFRFVTSCIYSIFFLNESMLVQLHMEKPGDKNCDNQLVRMF